MDKCLGFGGLGDCFIVILKLLEYNRPFVYTHIDSSANRLKRSEELLDYFKIQHDCKVVSNIKEWWYANHEDYDKHFNVFAKGYIDIPRRSYHWDPCIDEGYHNPFAADVEKKETAAIQVNAGSMPRHYTKVPIVETALENFKSEDIVWVGTDKKFEHEAGINYCGKLTLIETLEVISECAYFIGFPSILLYWALYHKCESLIFTDHQGHFDLRIHDAWREYITYDDESNG